MRGFGKLRRGALLLMAMCLVAVVAIALASYIVICNRSLDLSTREYHFKNARYLAEIGLEEALWSLNNSNWATNGTWTGTTTKTFTFTGYNFDSVVHGQPYTFATGQVAVTVTNVTGNTPGITAVGTVTISNIDNVTATDRYRVYTKTLTATTRRTPQFTNAIASAAGTVTFNSDGKVDSFNSSVAAYAAPSSSTGYAAVVAGNNVALSSADVKGYVVTYGNAPTYTGSATIMGFTSPAASIDTSRIGTSAYIPLFTPTAPTTPWTGTLTNNASRTIGTIGGTTPVKWNFSGNYTLSSATLTVQGPAQVLISGNLAVTGSGRIIVNNTSNASLEIFVTGNVTVSSTNGFINRAPSAGAPVPDNLALYITGSGSTLTWNTAARYDGVIYATHANAGTMTVSNANAVFYGALLSNKDITFTGTNPNIHYDNALRSATFLSFTSPFVIGSISELTTER